MSNEVTKKKNYKRNGPEPVDSMLFHTDSATKLLALIISFFFFFWLYPEKLQGSRFGFSASVKSLDFALREQESA